MNDAQTPPKSLTLRAAGRSALAICIALIAARLFAVTTSPLELGPDEAQYWGWSRNLDWGYFSKPPLIAWVIAATTKVFGDAEWAIRISVPLAHALCAAAIAYSANALAGRAAATPAALLYLSAPGVAVSSFIISTDAFLLAASAIALAISLSIRTRPTWLKGAALGTAIGLGLLAKYAMVYAVFAITIGAIFDRKFRKSIVGWPLAAAIAAIAALIIPNVVWNATHSFATFNHTAANANLENSRYSIGKLAEFFIAQFGVFGPIAFALIPVALLSDLTTAKRERTQSTTPASTDLFRQTKPLLAATILLPLIVVGIGAFVSRANANWAAIAYPSGAVLVAAWCILRGQKTWLFAAIAINLVFSTLIVAITTAPRIADQIGIANSIKRTRGWSDITQSIISAAADKQSIGNPYSHIVFDNRLVFHEVEYYGRKTIRPPSKMWRKTAAPLNHAQATAPLTPGPGPFLVVLSTPTNKAIVSSDFATFDPVGSTTVFLGGGKKRHLDFYSATNYSPKVRDADYERRWSATDANQAD